MVKNPHFRHNVQGKLCPCVVPPNIIYFVPCIIPLCIPYHALTFPRSCPIVSNVPKIAPYCSYRTLDCALFFFFLQKSKYNQVFNTYTFKAQTESKFKEMLPV